MIDVLIRGRREASGARREGCPKIGYPRAERQPGGRAKRGGDTFLFWGDACNQPATTLTAAHRFFALLPVILCLRW
jgi:hypothetical protein